MTHQYSQYSQHPQHRFLWFKETEAGKYDITESYEKLVDQKKEKNKKEISDEIINGNMSESTILKFDNWFDGMGRKGMRTHSDLQKIAQESYCSDVYDNNKFLLDVIIDRLSLSTSRQNLGEKYCENCLEYVSNNVDNFKWERLTGERSRWVDKSGYIVDCKPKNNINIKSLDYRISYGSKKDIYISQKRMKISGGGHQNSQASELYRFAQATVDANNFIPVIILDGKWPAEALSEIIGLNNKIVLVESRELYYFAKWLETGSLV